MEIWRTTPKKRSYKKRLKTEKKTSMKEDNDSSYSKEIKKKRKLDKKGSRGRGATHLREKLF